MRFSFPRWSYFRAKSTKFELHRRQLRRIQLKWHSIRAGQTEMQWTNDTTNVWVIFPHFHTAIAWPHINQSRYIIIHLKLCEDFCKASNCVQPFDEPNKCTSPTVNDSALIMLLFDHVSKYSQIFTKTLSNRLNSKRTS